MKFRLNGEWKKSLAEELKKLGWAGVAVFTALGWPVESPWVLAGLVLWWSVFQVLAHLVLGTLEDD